MFCSREMLGGSASRLVSAAQARYQATGHDGDDRNVAAAYAPLAFGCSAGVWVIRRRLDDPLVFACCAGVCVLCWRLDDPLAFG